MSGTLGQRITVPELFSALGSTYVEQYTRMLESFGVQPATVRADATPTDKIVVTQFAGLSASPDGSTGAPPLTTKDYANPLTPVPPSYVKTVTETVTLTANKFKLVDDKEIFTGFAKNAGSITGNPLGLVARTVADQFLNAMESDLVTKITNTSRKVVYPSQGTNNVFSVSELVKAATALAGRRLLSSRFSLICHPNIFAMMATGAWPDIYKLSNQLAVANTLTAGGIQFLQVLLSDKCQYDSSTKLYTSYLLMDNAVNYYVHTWEIDFNPYGWGTYPVYLRPSDEAIDPGSGARIWFFEGKWAFHIPDYGTNNYRICEFKAKTEA